MLWFKHSGTMLTDGFIMDAMDRFGLDAYGVWNGLLEIYASECGHEPGAFVQISLAKMKRFFRKTSRKILEIIQFFSEKSKIILEIGTDSIRVKIPKMKDWCDNWTDRKIRENRQNSGVTPPQKQTQIQNKDKEKTQKKEKAGSPKVCVLNVSDFALSCQMTLRKMSGLSEEKTQWVLGFIDMTLDELKTSRPDLGEVVIKQCWHSACEQSVARRAASPLYYQKVFHALITQAGSPERPNPGQQTLNIRQAEQDALRMKIETLLAAPLITSVFGETRSTKDLVYDPSNAMYPIQSNSGDGFRIDHPRYWQPASMKQEA